MLAIAVTVCGLLVFAAAVQLLRCRRTKPEFSWESERAVLGAMMADPSMILEVVCVLPSNEHLAVALHREVFDMILVLHDTARAVSASTVAHALIHRESPDVVRADVLQGWDRPAPRARVLEHAVRVRRLSDQRRAAQPSGGCAEPCPLGLPAGRANQKTRLW